MDRRAQIGPIEFHPIKTLYATILSMATRRRFSFFFIAYLTLIGLDAPAENPDKIAIAPFEDIGVEAGVAATGRSLVEGLAGILETRHYLNVEVIKSASHPPRTSIDPNTQLLPPAYRSGYQRGAGKVTKREDWLEMARRDRASVLILGTYEQLGDRFRIVAEGLEPRSDQKLFRCLVEGETARRFSLESELAVQISDQLSTQDRTQPETQPQEDILPLAAEPIIESEVLTAEEHYENGFALTRRYDETKDEKFLAGAIDEYRAALALDPNHLRSLNNLGTVLHRKGSYEEALGYYLKVLELNSTYVRAMENAALAYKGLGQLDKAEEMWRQSLLYEEREEERLLIQKALEGLQ